MKKIKHLIVHAVAISGLVWSATAAALSYNAGPTDFDGAWGSGHQGQAFTPNENEDPTSGAATAYLQQLEFTRGGTVDANVGNVETYVDIYQPTPGSTIATSTIIGSSITSQDTTDTVDGTVYTFQFDNLALAAGTTYFAVFRDASNNIIRLNLRQSYEPDVAATLGTAYDYVGGGAIFDYDVSGWSSDTNLDFTALYSNSTPSTAATFTSGVTQVWGQWSTGMQGQAFIPRINATPNPVGTPSTVFLQNMQFTLGGFDNQPGDASTTLDIYIPGATIASSTLVGSSSNTVDTVNPTGDEEDDFGRPPIMYNFEFDNLELYYNTVYIAVFKDGLGNVISLNIEQGFEGNDMWPGDVPKTVGGGGLYTYDADGWSEETNADFTATFSTASSSSDVSVPMIGWLGLVLMSAGLAFVARFARRVS